MYIDNLFNIKNKVIIVTGSSQGIGLEIAKYLNKYGAIVHGVSRRTVKKPKYDFHHVCDLTDENEVINLMNTIYAKSKKINVLINNAGFTTSNSSIEKSYKNFDKTIAINLKAIYYSSLLCSKLMKKSDKCSIINISSLGGFFAFPANPSYLASKGGLRSLSKGLALDFSEKNIRVNCIVPGYIKTKMTENSFNNIKARDLRTKRTINQKWGRPRDLVGAAIFLSSAASEYINGQDIIIDGGWSAKGL